MLTFRLCISSILAGKRPGSIPLSAMQDDAFTVRPMAPPPPKKEAMPTRRDGVIWSPGYWKYADTWFVWCSGHWELSRPDQTYRPPRWERYADGWHFEPAMWIENGPKGKRREMHNDMRYDVLGAFR